MGKIVITVLKTKDSAFEKIKNILNEILPMSKRAIKTNFVSAAGRGPCKNNRCQNGKDAGW